MMIKKRLLLVLVAIVVVVMTGSIGYFIIFRCEPDFIDCMYMTIISLTTVGYGEVLEITDNVTAEIFTMFLITFGMGIIIYGISTLSALLIEGELTGILRKRQMEKKIQKMRNHYIVCGGGETGFPLIDELVKNKESVVLIEQDQEKIERCKAIEGLMYVLGDATDDQNLITAGVLNASGIVVCLPADKDNLYVTMTARMLNKEIRIISKMINPKLGPKLEKAGADSVVSPNNIGALRMASEMIRPTVVDFLDSMLRSSKGHLRIHQLAVSDNSSLLGKKIGESRLKEKYDLLVLGSRYLTEEIEFNPSPSKVLEKGMTLIVMGDMDNIAKAKKMI